MRAQRVNNDYFVKYQVGIDLVGPLPASSSGNRYIVTQQLVSSQRQQLSMIKQSKELQHLFTVLAAGENA